MSCCSDLKGGFQAAASLFPQPSIVVFFPQPLLHLLQPQASLQLLLHASFSHRCRFSFCFRGCLTAAIFHCISVAILPLPFFILFPWLYYRCRFSFSFRGRFTAAMFHLVSVAVLALLCSHSCSHMLIGMTCSHFSSLAPKLRSHSFFLQLFRSAAMLPPSSAAILFFCSCCAPQPCFFLFATFCRLFSVADFHACIFQKCLEPFADLSAAF